MTEQDMREAQAPTPETTEELAAYIDGLVGQEHYYGTCVYAMSLAATAAFNHVAHKLGVTEFQASCAALDIVRRTRMIDGPFALVKGEDMLFPQYDIPGKVREMLDEWGPWASTEARKKLSEMQADGRGAHPNVVAHWRSLAAKYPETDEA